MVSRRDLKVVILVLFAGAMIGTLFGDLIGFVLPEGVVKQFFLQSTEFSLGGLVGTPNDAISLDIGAIALILGLKIQLNFATIFGLAVSYYFLRYFR
ncbi:MAG TPA: hypothetical protein EYN68_01860 [Candidatus Marinimicrobia bacterium]|jgi:hypothetical protein|nr:hypothetical protein [Candidatus Neomarinimicrobiota bacterium]HHZ98309.1 hypothetical protein [Candidatus Neomarinimicrobiota bacterium]HIB03345.1 hypothetical protein [Candidatus Neomarinimicrobiota bacterium]HIB72004.1 hypothetical protein [Candidatus Neomarinimicrobiota bacterium]HIB95697.1 hypothetical protein [Candidatus Neomarinimicrobiota bacterium]